MNKLTKLKITNVILFILLVCQATTGLGFRFINEEFFENIHPLNGLLLIIVALIHLILNWGWVKANFLKH